MSKRLHNMPPQLYFESPQNRWRCAAGGLLLAIGVPATLYAAATYSKSESEHAAYEQNCLNSYDPSINYCDFADTTGPDMSSALRLAANSITIDAVGGYLVYAAAQNRKRGRDINFGKVRRDIDHLQIEDEALILNGRQLDAPPTDPTA